MDIGKELSNPVLLWFVVGLAMFLLELVSPGFFILFFGIGAWIVAVICYFSDLTLNAQLISFILASSLSLIFLRKWLRGVLKGFVKAEQDPNKEMDDFVGQKAVVKERIEPKRSGKVELHGTPWEAESSETIEKGETVKVVSKNSLVLQVKKL
jgi:membrane protein implicated in regulation of membrane protease activity